MVASPAVMLPLVGWAMGAALVPTELRRRSPPVRLRQAPHALCASDAEAVTDLAGWIASHGGGGSLRITDVGDGLRGLVCTRDALVGDVLLEVPLKCVLANRGDGERMAAEPPEWCSGLPWNVQLALSVLARETTAEWKPFLTTWPAELPELPMGLEPEELAAAQDPSFEAEADQSCFWVQEQYFNAFDAAEADHQTTAMEGEVFSFPSEPAFRRAMLLVWSRCLRLTAGPYGVRRLLVPMLDMANHDGEPPSPFTPPALVDPFSIMRHSSRTPHR